MVIKGCIATWDDAGMPLLDVDVLPSEKTVLNLPLKSEYLSLFGYGGDKNLFDGCIQGAGAISLNYSTDDTAGVGFHPRSRLVSSPIGYLCRGGLVNLSTIRQAEKPWINAVEALKHTKQSILKTSSQITTFAIVHSHDDLLFIGMQRSLCTFRCIFDSWQCTLNLNMGG